MGERQPRFHPIQHRRIEQETIERMLGHLEMLATGILADPSRPISGFPLLTAAEQQQILVDWNAPQKPLHRRPNFAQPDFGPRQTKFSHPAVIGGDKIITYRELDLQSGNLARYLHRASTGKAIPKSG